MHSSKILIAAGLSIALAGCNTMGSNTSMYSIHQPVVERTSYAIDVATDGNGIASAEQTRMAEWFDGLQLGYGDRVAIDYGSGYESAVARRTVADLAGNHGVLVSDSAPVTAGTIAPGNLRVVVTRSSASVPSCPDWSNETSANYNSANHSNHGCSTNSNLAAMVADPEDLVRGRENTKLNRNSGNKAVEAYRAKTGGN